MRFFNTQPGRIFATSKIFQDYTLTFTPKGHSSPHKCKGPGPAVPMGMSFSLFPVFPISPAQLLQKILEIDGSILGDGLFPLKGDLAQSPLGLFPAQLFPLHTIGNPWNSPLLTPNRRGHSSPRKYFKTTSSHPPQGDIRHHANQKATGQGCV